MDALYKVYVVAIFGGIGLAVLAGAIADAPLGAAELRWLAERGPAVLGAIVALATLFGLRSGSRGGPLAIEAAEVQYVLLAPVDRGAALRPAALKQARVAVPTGAALGLAVGAFAIPRLPGSSVEWLGVLAAFGALLPLCYFGAALLACGRRFGPGLAGATGLLLLAWSLVDLAVGAKTCPATMLGVLATLPLQSGVTAALSAVGAVAAVAVVLAGMGAVGGLSLELARRRSTLVAELRFSAAVQDLRTVVLLRRQLAAERPRRRPWLRLGLLGGSTSPIERRSLRSFLRWPAERLARVALGGVLTGLVIAGFWSGTTPLIAVAGAIMFVVALDTVEPLAQEVDHPTRRDLLPIDVTGLLRHHLVVPSLAMALVGALSVLTALALGASGVELGVGVAMLLPTGLLLTACAALSTTYDPYRYTFTPELGYAITAAPIAIAIVGVGGPVLAARAAVESGQSPLGVTISIEAVLLLVAIAMVSFVAGQVASSGRSNG